MAKFDDYGIRKGLAYTHDWQASMNNMLRVQQYKDQQQMNREKKAAYNAERMKHGQAQSEYNSSRLQDFYNGVNRELGKFMVENPDYETNATLVAQYNTITDKYLNNSILREDLEVQKAREMMNNDRHNMSETYFNQLVEEYDAYSNQEYDKKNPDAESALKFSYSPETRLPFSSVISDISKIITTTPGTRVGDKFIYATTKVNEKSLEAGYASMVTDPNYSKSLDRAYNSYLKRTDDPLKLTKEQFGKDSLRNAIPIGEVMKTVNPSYKAGLNNDSEFTGSPYFYNLLKQLNDNGVAKTSYNALALTVAQRRGGRVNLPEAGAIFLDGQGAIKDFEWKDIMVSGTAVSTSEMRYVGENGATYVKTSFIIPKLTENSVAINQLKDMGWSETSGTYSDAGFVMPSFDGEKEFLMGSVWLPADINPSNYYNYESSFDATGPGRSRAIHYKEAAFGAYGAISDELGNRYEAARRAAGSIGGGQQVSTIEGDLINLPNQSAIPKNKGNINLL